MLNSISLGVWIRSSAGMPLALILGMGMAAAVPPLAAQRVILDSAVVVINVHTTVEERELNQEQQRILDRLGDALLPVGLFAMEACGDPGVGELFGPVLGPLCDPEAREEEPAEPSNYTIYIRDNRMAVHAKGFDVMVWRVIPGSGAQMYFYDPETDSIQNFGGQVPENLVEELNLPDLNLQDPEGRLNLQAADRVTETVSIDYIPRGPSLLGADGERLGYPVHRYELGHQMVPEWARNAPFGTMRVYSDGEAWIAHDTPYNEVVGRFFENFAAHVDSGTGGMLAGLTASMAQLGRLGVPMETVDTSSVRLTLTRMGVGPGNPETGLAAFPDDELILEQTVTTTVVKDIRFGHYGVEELKGIFGPEPPSLEGNPDSPTGPEGGDPCDCSCSAMHELEDLDESDPGALQKAMCAQQCMPQWLQRCIGSGCSES